MLDLTTPYNELPLMSTLYVEISNELSKLAEDTRVAIEILRYAAKSLPNPDVLLETLALQEAKASSKVENITTTNDDLYRSVAFEDYTAEAKEVSRYKEALFLGYQLLREKGRITITDLNSINALVNNKQKGIRTNLPNFSDLTRITHQKPDGTKEIIYTPPHGKELLQELLIDMLDFIYDDDTFSLHPLIKIALAHYQFECIHPFRDGNGRTGRIINVLFLCYKDYLDAPILYASSYISKNKRRYYELLRTVKETEQYEKMISFMLLSFKETAEHTLRIVERIKALLDQYTQKEFLQTLKGQYDPLQKTVNLIFKKVYVRVSDVVALGIHRQTAASYLDQLAEEGLLSKEKIGRDNIYKNIKLLELFENDCEVTA